MRSVIVRLLLLLGAAALVALALRANLRAALLAEFHDPTRLPALAADPRVHFEPAARACAARVAAVLPAAMAQIETIHGLPFAKPPVIGVYASFESYARANGLGDAGVAGVAGVTRAGRALLSPTLCGDEGDRLASVLTHELSHVHFSGWRIRMGPAPPAWFTEGLAVMASDGGGAEGVSDAEAAQALQAGVAIIPDDVAWLDFAAIRFTREPVAPPGRDPWTYRQRLAFRQAGLFVRWLRARDPDAFNRFLRGLEAGQAFDKAFATLFGGKADAAWRAFLADPEPTSPPRNYSPD
jgi:hypothetical protein